VSGDRLAGRVAVVVGAGQTPGTTIGNGRATAVLLAREGATVVCADRDPEAAAATVAQIVEEGGEAWPIEVDIVHEHRCADLVAAVVDRHGRIDVLHNNVGIGMGDDSVLRLDEAHWHRILDVNLTGMWLTCKHAIPVMRAGGGGAVVNVSSLAAVAATPMVAYKVSKAGVNALTQTLALGNAKHGIRVNAVMPGLIDTPMAIEGMASATGLDPDDLRRGRDAMVPLGGRQGTAWDVARAALFLASDDAAFITGVVLPVDGGQHARVG
jgi:NAD(P)-dependent dehydrogenase (short-subunit alcohol dehydrogenase family)